MKYLIIFLMLFLPLTLIHAQNSFLADWHLGVSYFGNNLWNPGAQITGQKLIFNRTTIKTTRKENFKSIHKQLFIDTNLGFYYDNPSHWSVFNNYQFHFRRVREKGKYRNIGLGPGILRTILPETYNVSSVGNIIQVKNPGNWYFSPVFTLGVGRLWKRNGTNPWRLQLHTMVLMKYNLSVLPTLNVEYGYVFGYDSKEKYDHLEN